MKANSLRADALLLLTAAVWGFAFVAQRAGMEHVGPFTFNAIRFALGGVVLLPVIRLRKQGRILEPRAWRAGLTAGSVLFLGASLQQIGVVYTTAGKAGFITGLYVIIVPLLGLLWGQRPGLGTWVGAMWAVLGLYLLSAADGLGRISLGDLLVLCSALFWACHVLVIGRFSPDHDPILLACLQFLTCSALSWGGALVSETITSGGIRNAAGPILYAGLLSTGVAYTLQVIAQRRARAAHAAIIMSLEAVFAALGGWLMLAESLSFRALAGCGLMLMGTVSSRIRTRDRIVSG